MPKYVRPHEDRLNTPEEVARRLTFAEWTIREYIRKGKIRAVRIGKKVLIAEEEVQRIIHEGLDVRRTLSPDLTPEEREKKRLAILKLRAKYGK